jgi:hypothetical protein
MAKLQFSPLILLLSTLVPSSLASFPYPIDLGTQVVHKGEKADAPAAASDFYGQIMLWA